MEQEDIIEIEEADIIVKEENQIAIQREVDLGMAKIMEMAEVLSKSTIIPVSYQRRPENCYIALDMANRMGVSPLVVMQNLYVIQGKPSFSGQAIASMIRSSPQLCNVEVHYVGTEGKDDWGCYITAENIRTGKVIKGATVTIRTAKLEGWYQKPQSKWQTIPEVMLAYRAYAWFGRVHCPELLMGLQSTEEVYDLVGREFEDKPSTLNPYAKEGDK